MSGLWWELIPGRLEYELEALARAGIAYDRDEVAIDHGIMRLNLWVEVAGERLPLVVTFPDLYPYFRFEVDAPTLDLTHHQNPFAKNLCLLGRDTYYWDTTDTVAGLLAQQLPTVLDTGRSSSKGAALGREHQQAEPAGVFFPYATSMVILPSGCTVPHQFDCGTFTVATSGPQGPPPENFLRGALISLNSTSGKQFFQSDPGLLLAYSGDRLRGSWLRVSEPFRNADQGQVHGEILARSTTAKAAPANRVNGGWLQIWGVVFPEEVEWRMNGDGWLFVCRFERQRSRMISLTPQPQRPMLAPKNKRKPGKGRRR